MKKFTEQLSLRVISFLGWLIIDLLARTCRYQVTGYENALKMIKSGDGLIMAIWHGRTMLPICYCRGLGIWAITSLSKDGEIQTRIVNRFGYQIIRGSTGRGAIKAALIAAKKLEAGGVLAITPDGPKGPPNEVQEGTIFLAQKANCPIIPIGVGISPRKIIPVWDSYAFPMPFAKCAIIFGDPIYLTDADPNPSHAEIIKNALNDVQSRAQLAVKEG